MIANQERIWIVGSQGRVGSAFADLLDTTEVEVFPTDIGEVDITDHEAVSVFLEINRPDVIINCAGLTDVDYCESHKEEAFRVNALGARNLSVAARRYSARMVQISTDDIFDGQSEKPYDEFDVPNPISIYGKSKLAGEQFVKELSPKHLIVRSSWVYGGGNDYVMELLQEARKQNAVTVAAGQTASPTSAKEVAKTIYRLLERDAYGTYHAVCQGACSRCEFAQKVLQLAGIKTEVVETHPQEMPKTALRPAYTVLDDLMLRISGIEVPVYWTEALKEYMDTL